MLFYINFSLKIGHLPFSMTSTVSAWIKPQGCIFQNGFLGGVLFEFDLPGVVIKLGLYLLRNVDFKPLIACAHFKSLSTLDAHWKIPVIWKLNIILLIKEHKEVFFSIQYYLLYTWRQGGVLFKLGLYFFNFSFWLGFYYHFGRVGLYSRVRLYSSGYGSWYSK